MAPFGVLQASASCFALAIAYCPWKGMRYAHVGGLYENS